MSLVRFCVDVGQVATEQNPQQDGKRLQAPSKGFGAISQNVRCYLSQKKNNVSLLVETNPQVAA